MERKFVEAEIFTKLWKHFDLSEEDFRALQLTLLSDPKAGDFIEGTGGVQKIRLSSENTNRGKSSSYRICYFDAEHTGHIFLIFIFSKEKLENLTNADKKEIKALVKRLKNN